MILPNKRRDKAFIVYVFFVIAVGLYFYGQIAEGKLTVSTQPEGARVFLNKKDYGNSPVTVSLRSGEYRLEVVLRGYDPVAQTVHVGPGKTTSLDLHLVQKEKEKQ